MSDFDEVDFDEELESLYEEDLDSLSPEEFFKMVTINKIKGITVRVELRDEEGDKIELADIIQQLTEYIQEKMQDTDGNQFADQIMPLMAQSIVSGLGRMVGIPLTSFYLANDLIRTSIINMMAISLLLHKFVQKNNLTIHTIEEKITEEEMETIERKSKANSVATMGAFMGIDPKEMLKNMLDRGDITPEDFNDIINEGSEDDGDKGNN